MTKKKTRNPHAGVLSRAEFRPRVEKTAKEKAEIQSGGTRKAKHKKVFQLGDTVEYQGDEAVVKNPNGPDDLVGISIDGVYTLAHADQLEMLEESLRKMREISTRSTLVEMSYIVGTSGIQMPISIEETEVLDKVKDGLAKRELNEREREVARKMVSRGILQRYRKDDKLFFRQHKETLRR